MRAHLTLSRPAAVGAVALALAACSPTTRPAPTTTQRRSLSGSTTTSPSSTVSTTSTSTTAAPVTTSSAAGPGRCRTSELRATASSAGVAAGSVGQTITWHSTATASCSLDGYPGLLMLDAQGRPLTTVVHRGSGTTVAARPVTLVTLSPGGTASFDLGYHDATGFSGAAPCPTSAQLEVTAPNAYQHLVIADRLSPYGPCGAITVSPVYAGSGPSATG